MKEDEIEEAFRLLARRQEATEMAVLVLVDMLEKNGLLGEREFANRIHILADLIDVGKSADARETARWLRTKYGREQHAAEILAFPDKNTSD